MPRVRFEVREKSHEDCVSDVKSLFQKIPKDAAIWNRNTPHTPEEVENLVRGLTLADKFTREERACFSWEILLLEYGRVVESKGGKYEWQTYTIIYTAMSMVAKRLGRYDEKFVHNRMRALNLSNSALRLNRVAIPKLIKLLDNLASIYGERAYEVPMRRMALFTQAGRLTEAHFKIIRQILGEPDTLSIPNNLPSSARLRIPDIVYELVGGENRRILQEGKASVKDRALKANDIASILGVESNLLVHLEPQEPQQDPLIPLGWSFLAYSVVEKMGDLN